MLKALVVDDKGKVRNLYKKVLEAESFTVLDAINGEHAASMLLEHPDIDLVLLDIRMPMANGTALFDLIKHHNPEAKVIITSVYSPDEQRRMINGADGYHEKSEGTDKLLSSIRSVLPNARARE